MGGRLESDRVLLRPGHRSLPRGHRAPLRSMTLPINGLNRAMKSPWVVMINPTDAGATPNPSRIRFSTGAMMLPAIIVRVAEARMIPREKFFETAIMDYLPHKIIGLTSPV